MSLDLKGWKSMDTEINVRKLKTLYAGDEVEKLAKALMKKKKMLKPIDFHKTVKNPYIQCW